MPGVLIRSLRKSTPRFLYATRDREMQIHRPLPAPLPTLCIAQEHTALRYQVLPRYPLHVRHIIP